MPSLSQKSFHVALVARLPDQLCASSCATRLTRLLSPAMKVGVRKVRSGFSMPPSGIGRRQDQHVVTAPAIGAVELLGGGDHLLGVGQLARGGVERRRLGPHAGARPERLEREVADRNRDHVGRDAVVHAKVEDAFAALGDRLLDARRAHHRGHARGHVDRRFPGLPDAGRILGRNPAPVVDRFALAEQERGLLAGGLLRVSHSNAPASGALL